MVHNLYNSERMFHPIILVDGTAYGGAHALCYDAHSKTLTAIFLKLMPITFQMREKGAVY